MLIKGKNIPIASVLIALLFVFNSALVYAYEKYWFLEPVLAVYVIAISLQFIVWVLLLYLEDCWRLEKILETKLPVKSAFIIGLLWSLIQIIWIKQWWTWLNLISQPLLYGLVAMIIVYVYKKSIDQINKIRHYDVDKNI